MNYKKQKDLDRVCRAKERLDQAQHRVGEVKERGGSFSMFRLAWARLGRWQAKREYRRAEARAEARAEGRAEARANEGADRTRRPRAAPKATEPLISESFREREALKASERSRRACEARENH